MTQQDLAGEYFSKSYLSAVERGKMTPSLPALRLLAQRLEVPLAYLLGEQEIDLQDPPTDQDILLQRFQEVEELLSRKALEEALVALGESEPHKGRDLRHQARWDWLYGWALIQQRREQEALVTLKRGLEAAHAHPDPFAAGHLYLTLAHAHANQRQDTAAEEALAAALRCAPGISDQRFLSCVHERYGALRAAQGRFKEAYEHVSAANARRAVPDM
jgi:transcriptional regulator with XRE-family HTH domain